MVKSRARPRKRRLLVLEGWQDHALFQELNWQTRMIAVALHTLRNERTRWHARDVNDILDQQASQDFAASFNEIARGSGASRRKGIYAVALFIRLGLLARTSRGNSTLRSDGVMGYQQANRYLLPRWPDELLDVALEVWQSMPAGERYRCGLRNEGGSAPGTLGVVHQGTGSPPLPSAPEIPPGTKEREIDTASNSTPPPTPASSRSQNRRRRRGKGQDRTTDDLNSQAFRSLLALKPRSLQPAPASGMDKGDDKGPLPRGSDIPPCIECGRPVPEGEGVAISTGGWICWPCNAD